MSRDSFVGTALRPLLVWLAVTSASAAAVRLAADPVLAAGADPTDAGFADLLVAVCALCLLVAAAHLWLVTTLTVTEVLRRAVRPSTAGATRRLVLLACGSALAAGTAAPAAAADGDAVLAGLRLPDRAVSSSAVSSPVAPAAEVSAGTDRPSSAAGAQVPADGLHVVRPGESLWSIAADTLPAGAPAARDLDARWRAIWAANRDVVGPDPDLILPGQLLRLPSPADPSTQLNAQPSTQPSSNDPQGDRP